MVARYRLCAYNFCMGCCIPGTLHTCWDTFQKDFRAEIRKIPANLGQADQVLGTSLGLFAYGLWPIVQALETAVGKTAAFVANNWKQLIGYIFAWGVIITCTGLLYGFQAVALPLTIGLGCGAAFGVIAGILSVNSFDPQGKYTLWNLLNQGIDGLDQNGTRQIVLAVAVTVLLAASVVFPYVMGAVFGLFIALQVAVKIGSGQNLGRDLVIEENAREVLQSDLLQAQDLLKTLQERFEALPLTPNTNNHDRV